MDREFGVHPDQIENMGDWQSNDQVGSHSPRSISYVPSPPWRQKLVLARLGTGTYRKGPSEKGSKRGGAGSSCLIVAIEGSLVDEANMHLTG